MPVRPPRTAEELLKELQQLFNRSDSGPLGAEAVSAIARQVEGITRRFAEIAGVYRRIEVYYHRLRDMGLEQTLDRFGATERESLGLAIFLLEQLDSDRRVRLLRARDPHLQRGRDRSPAAHLRVPRSRRRAGQTRKQTLGVLPWMRQNPSMTEGNWERLTHYTAARWGEQIDPGDTEKRVSFDQFVAKALSRISQLRNMAAHTHPLSRKDYSELQRLAFQGGPLGYGTLNALLLAWRDA